MEMPSVTAPKPPASKHNASSTSPQWNFINLSNNSAANETSPLNSNDFEKYIISITTDANYNSTAEYSDAFLAFDIENHHHAHIPSITDGDHEKHYVEYITKLNENATNSRDTNFTFPIVRKPIEGSVKEEDLLSSFFGFLFKDVEPTVAAITDAAATRVTATTQKSKILISSSAATITTTIKPIASYNHTDLKKENEVPLKLLNILNVTKEKKENETKFETPQRKNNKITNSNDDHHEPTLDENEKVTILSNRQSGSQASEVLRDVLLATINGGVPIAGTPGNSAHNEFISSQGASANQGVNIESKSNFQYNPIRSEVELVLSDLNKPDNDLDHNHYNNAEQYQYLPGDPSQSHTESYVIHPVNVDKLKQHQDPVAIITKPPNNLRNSDPAGILKLAGCNIYGRMYRVGRIISELSNPCLLCKCTEFGVNCTPLSC